MIINTQHYQSKIIFPDYKFDLNLNIADKNYTIKNLLDDSRKGYERDNILNIAFLDEEGNQIGNTTKASMLLRLDKFIISVNWGERIYNCLNPHFMGNNRLDKEVMSSEGCIDQEKLNRLIFENNLPFSAALKFSTVDVKGDKQKIKFSSILEDYIKNKYSVVSQFCQSVEEKRERRIQKMINTFFYASLIQVTTLNLCTFVFFSWDFMEPITLCISYLNIIFGYYYWALTQTDYEVEAIVYWMRNIRPIFKPSVINLMLQEKEEISSILKEDVFKL